MRKNYFLAALALILLILAAGVHAVLDAEHRRTTTSVLQENADTGTNVNNMDPEQPTVPEQAEPPVLLDRHFLPCPSTPTGVPEQIDPQVLLDLHKLTVEETIALFSFLASPIKNASVTTARGQLPNAPRTYRNGIHEGIDYYGFPFGKEVIAAAAGIVIRIDHDFVEMTLEEYNEAIRVSHAAAITPEAELDKFRGKQVWLKHQNSIITRYAHLDSVVSEIKIGQTVEAGQVIGTVGNTGVKSSVVGRILNPSGAPHLHFEIWLNDVFLGQGLPHNEVLHIYREVLDN